MSVILGIGTGRCGTVSLARLLDAQPGVICTHEDQPYLPWHFNWENEADWEAFHIHVARFRQKQSKAKMVGDVAFYWLPYLHEMLSSFPGLKVICLKRDRDETIASYMKKTRGRNHWMPHDGSQWRLDPTWDPCYPKYPDAQTKEEAIGRYWDDYYRTAERWAQHWPDQVRIFDMDVLNSEEGQDQIFDFLGLKEHVHMLPCRFNVGTGAA